MRGHGIEFARISRMPATSIGNPHNLQTTNLDWFDWLTLVCRGEGHAEIFPGEPGNGTGSHAMRAGALSGT
jgi:hypothetical protein